MKIFIYGEREKRANYVNALEGCGAEAVVSMNIAQANGCDGLLLAGGGDISPDIYGQKNNGSRDIDKKLDEAELALVEKFYRSGRPILGICRGMQVINAAFGGDLIQDIESGEVHRWTEKTGDKVHYITAKSGFLNRLYGERFSVNSAHHQAVGKIADGFTVAAVADDGIVEAIECAEKNIFAVQWHPERMCFENSRNDTVDGKLVFAYFLSIFGQNLR